MSGDEINFEGVLRLLSAKGARRIEGDAAFYFAAMAGVPFSGTIDGNGTVTFTLDRPVDVLVDDGKLKVYSR